MIIITTSNAKLYMVAGLNQDTGQVWTDTLGYGLLSATMLYSGDNVTSIYSFLRKGGSYYNAQYSRKMYTYSSKAI